MKTFILICLSLLIVTLTSACGPVIQPAPAAQIQDSAYHLAWSRDDRWLAASGNSGLYLIDPQTYQQKTMLPAASNADIAFGTRLMATNDGQTVRVWGLKDDRLLFEQHGATPIDFQSIGVSRDDTLLVTGEQKHFRVWSLPEGTLLADIPIQGFVSNVAFMDDNSLVVIIQYQALIQTWDVIHKKLIHSFENPRDVIFFTLSVDGRTALVDYNDPGFESWDIPAARAQHTYSQAISAAGWERLSGDNRFAVSWGYNIDAQNSGMSVWDLSNDSRVREFATAYLNGDGWRGAALNSDGSILAASNTQGEIIFYNVSGGQPLGRFQLPFTSLP